MNARTVAALLAAVAMAGAVQAFEVERVFRQERHSRGDTNLSIQQPIDEASWIWLDGLDKWGEAVFHDTRTDAATLAKESQYFLRFRRDFESDGSPLELDVSADERYALLLDGKEISRGPHRGLKNRWHYQSYRITGLSAGTHRLEAVVWQIGEHAPLAQISVRGGFILKAYGAYDKSLTTGVAEWKAAELHNTRMTWKGKSGAFGVGSQCEVRGTSMLDEFPADSAYRKAVVVRGPIKVFAGLDVQGWMLFPTILRDMMFESKTPGAVKKGENLLNPGTKVPAGTKVEAYWDLGNYYCAYPVLRVSGGKGAKILWGWAEALRDSKGEKGDRAAFEGLEMQRPFEDTFLPDGRAGARFTTPWWRAGRWCRIAIETADEPLSVDGVEIVETRYPVKLEAKFECDDPFFAAITPNCERALQMCMHEMFFDCPYYEQQMYPGDSRLQFLVAGFFDLENRMVRNAMTLYDADRRDNGMIPMNCPTRGMQDALGFTACELMMFGDRAMNDENVEWLKARLPGMNHSLMGFEAFLNGDGLLAKTPGWNFVDWVVEWHGGNPPDANSGRPNAELNLQYLHALQSAVIAEEAVGETILAAHWQRKAEALKAAIRRAYWCPDKALFSSDLGHRHFSEHSQCLALLADVVTGEDAQRCFNALVTEKNLNRSTIYFRHYLFLTYFKFRRPDLFLGGLDLWKLCLDLHLSTLLEVPRSSSRSDCHGWGSHILWHMHTGLAGVKSAAPRYSKVLVAPQPGTLRFIKSSTPTPHGAVQLDLSFADGGASGTVTLPAGLDGDFEWNGERTALRPGKNEIGKRR